MRKLFISQPMNGLTNEEIKEQRQKIVDIAESVYKEKFEVIESFFENAPHEAKPLWYLAESIHLMANADVVAFGYGWENARGCKIEFQCAKEYGLEYMTIDKEI